ncbi:Ubiquitin-like protease domain-containing protein [Abeliophyllum distichum]|uniref:Ubiquitin-like protease domain-containing protein n=1 Tax=Abeliophyllum distichum TaxID=126358 RepID=A0ABD1TJ65_9LAMI
MEDKLRNSLKERESRCRYSLHGFPLAIMIWVFEGISNLGKKFAKKYSDGIPRMLAWELLKRLTSLEFVNVLESKELEVKSTLIPTEAELEKVYWKELTPCVEEEDTDSQDSKENERKHDGEPSHSFHQHSPQIWAFEAIPNLRKKFAKKYSDGILRMLAWELPKRLTSFELIKVLESKEVSQPPPVCHDHNIADVVRMEMEKLEERLLWVISKRLDQMEYKIDSLVEMAAVGRFHLTSVCDSPICNTTNVHVAPPEVKRKEEAGPNDITNELEKE